MKNNKISIIVPVYNSGKYYLKKCVGSVIKQTYTNWELIIVDDCSTDDSTNILKDCSLYDKRVKVIFNEKHSGLPGVVRNTGIKFANGFYIMFLDSDDYLEENALEQMYNYQIGFDTDWVICNFRKLKEKGFFINVPEPRSDNVPSESKFFYGKDIISYAILSLDQQNKNILFNFCWGKLYIAKFIKDNKILFNTELYTWEDVEFNFKYLKYVKNITYIKEILYNHIIHNDSVTFTPDLNKFFNYKKALNLIRPFYEPYLSKKVLNRKIGNAIISLTVIQLIRTGVNITKQNKLQMLDFYSKIINNKDIRKNLKFYRPHKGESILIPLLIFLKLKHFLLLVILYKSKKRYR